MTIRTIIKMLPEVYEFYVALIIASAERFVARQEAGNLRREFEAEMRRKRLYPEDSQPRLFLNEHFHTQGMMDEPCYKVHYQGETA